MIRGCLLLGVNWSPSFLPTQISLQLIFCIILSRSIRASESRAYSSPSLAWGLWQQWHILPGLQDLARAASATSAVVRLSHSHSKHVVNALGWSGTLAISQLEDKWWGEPSGGVGSRQVAVAASTPNLDCGWSQSLRIRLPPHYLILKSKMSFSRPLC